MPCHGGMTAMMTTPVNGLTLNELERRGEMRWRAEEHAWVADPDHVVRALTDAGFQEYKREIAKDNRSHATSGGIWQGLDPRTGVEIGRAAGRGRVEISGGAVSLKKKKKTERTAELNMSDH